MADGFKLPKMPADPPLLRIEPFKGVNLSVTPTQIDQSQSPDMLNMNIDERGALNKRTGYERVFSTSLGAGAINGLYEYRRINGQVLFLLAHGTKLYTQSVNAQPVEIYNGLANQQVSFFTMNDKCYLMDGANYLVYDGSTVAQITPYIPTMYISNVPGANPGGTLLEDFNLLGAGFKETFSGDATGKDFYLHLNSLDNTPVIVKVDNVIKTLTTDYTVDFAAGKISFVNAPAKGTNNVEITAYKTFTGFNNRIKNCRFSTIFGGSNDTRVFLSGNPNMPEYVWRLGLYDPTYAPENGFYRFNDKVKGFAKQYDYLVVERENGKHQVAYQTDANGKVTFPSIPINDQVGTIATHSIQIIENNPVSLSKNGVYMLMASNVRDERNVDHISEAVDSKLRMEANLVNAISVDFDKKYWLAVNGNVYVLDYTQKSEYNPYGEWYFYNNINASCFLEMGGYLYFGSSGEGLVFRFKKDTDVKPYNDDDQPISAYWKSKHFTFGADELRKLVEKVYYSLKPGARTSMDLYYVTNKKESNLVKTTRMDLLDFLNVDFTNFSFLTSEFPQESMAKIKAKKITHYQLVLQNDKVDESLGILSLGIKYRYQSYVK